MQLRYKIAEAAAPWVLWIDELEKAYSGVGESNDIMTRMFGYFLSWMQEKQSCVYVIATANKAVDLPLELKRKGRFDEIFCVNLPNREERKSIFKIHLKKKKKSLDDASLNSICQMTDGFNDADIESVVNESVEECFLSGERELCKNVLEGIVCRTISISKSCKQQIDEMKKAYKENNFKDATTGGITTLKISNMAKNENKILDELRRRGKIYEDPCPKSESIIGKLIDIFSKRK